MADKMTIREECPACGMLTAHIEEDGTVYIHPHNCPGMYSGPSRIFGPGEVIFVPANESDSTSELVVKYRDLQAKNKRLSSDLREMASDCAQLQKVLLDIGFKVRDVLGIDIVQKATDPRDGSWKCSCGMLHYKYMHSCCNCGRSKPNV